MIYDSPKKYGEFGVTCGVSRCNSRLKYISKDNTPFQIRRTCRSSMKSMKLICKLT